MHEGPVILNGITYLAGLAGSKEGYNAARLGSYDGITLGCPKREGVRRRGAVEYQRGQQGGKASDLHSCSIVLCLWLEARA